jgi:gephyrin
MISNSTDNRVDAHVDAIARGLQSADILLTTGGTSMGSTDLLKPVIEQHFDGTIHFGRVAIKPGKPTTFATIPSDGGIEKPIFALPGNPASALVTFHIFVLPALRKLSGYPERLCQLPRVPVKVKTLLLSMLGTDFQIR